MKSFQAQKKFDFENQTISIGKHRVENKIYTVVLINMV